MEETKYKPTSYIQYRCGNHNLGHRLVDPALNMYDDAQLKWYENPVDIPEPARLVMFEIRRCYLCGHVQPGNGTVDSGNCESDVGIYHEGVGNHPYGYRMCLECKPYYLNALKNKLGPVWRFRQQFDHNCLSDCHTPLHLWVARTRYDENGNRVRTGNMPFKYTSWHVARWSPLKYIDKYKVEQDPAYVNESCLIVASNDESVTKLVNIDDLFITNYGSISDPNYDPNMDDPLNKYSHEQRQQMHKEEIQRLARIVD
jgi:hypothetical protein